MRPQPAVRFGRGLSRHNSSENNVDNGERRDFLIFPLQQEHKLLHQSENCDRMDWISIDAVDKDDTSEDDLTRSSGKSLAQTTSVSLATLLRELPSPPSLLDPSDQKIPTVQEKDVAKPTIEYREGNGLAIFDGASQNVVVAHACNAEGHWGRGLAVDVKNTYASAYYTYREYCLKSAQPLQNVGKSMLIFPESSTLRQKLFPSPFIACLFTNKGVGGRYVSRQDVRDSILGATKKSLECLLDGIADAMRQNKIPPITEIRMPKINSGLFRVPWKRTEQLLLGLTIPPEFKGLLKIVVYSVTSTEEESRRLDRDSQRAHHRSS